MFTGLTFQAAADAGAVWAALAIATPAVAVAVATVIAIVVRVLLVRARKETITTHFG